MGPGFLLVVAVLTITVPYLYRSTDIKGDAPDCFHLIFCCAKSLDRVRVRTSSDGTKELVLPKGEGEPVSRKIMNQVEEAQQMERD